MSLCPGNNISARKRKHGRTGDAGTYIKPMLIQAAWAAIRVRGRLQARYNRLVRRFGGDKNPGAKKKAITAIAHTLLKIAYQVLKSGTPYQEPGADFTPGGNPPTRSRHTWSASCKSCTPAAPSPSPSARRRPYYHPALKQFLSSPGAAADPGTPGPSAGQISAIAQPSPPHRPGSAAARPAGTQLSCQLLAGLPKIVGRSGLDR